MEISLKKRKSLRPFSTFFFFWRDFQLWFCFKKKKHKYKLNKHKEEILIHIFQIFKIYNLFIYFSCLRPNLNIHLLTPSKDIHLLKISHLLAHVSYEQMEIFSPLFALLWLGYVLNSFNYIYCTGRTFYTNLLSFWCSLCQIPWIIFP